MVEWNRVTWYSKALAVGLFVVLVWGAFYYGTWYEKQFIPTAMADSAENEITNSGSDDSSDLLNQYKKADFKVVTIVPDSYYSSSTTTPNYEALYVVTNRGVNDDGCGGTYSAGACYFFLESDYAYTPPTTYLSMWSPDGTSIGSDSDIHFVNPNIIEFKTSTGDASGGVYETWNLDIRTRSTTLLTRRVTGE